MSILYIEETVNDTVDTAIALPRGQIKPLIEYEILPYQEATFSQ